MAHSWSNWSKTVTATPTEVATPWTTAALETTVHQALTQGRRLKAVGSGHSFTGVAVAEDIQVNLDNYTGTVAFDQQTGRITLRSGTRLWQIPQFVDGSGWAMQNLGDINQQSIAGAISTGTHGTGAAYGGLASQVVGLEVITGTGHSLSVSQEHEPELLDALRVSMGALGILTSVTLQLVPEYDLRTVEAPTSLEGVLTNWEALNDQHDHFEFFWFGHDHNVQTKSSRRQSIQRHTPSPLRRAQQWVNQELVSNGGLAVISQLGRRSSRWLPALNRYATRAWGRSDITAHWSSAFASSRRVRFNEMEYALPLDAIPEVVRELRALFWRKNLGSAFPLEIRSAAADTAWLATNHGRATGYIAAHQYFRQDFGDYFGQIEPILRAADGRPHWGKLHTLAADDFPGLYPMWAKMSDIREQLDPERVFANPYVTRVLGP
ncbi:D-arabinono-1,4-lactone oxidase [Enteractinococcus coprophilus]|uniref:FAD-linked oxidoreductase n=1 Tax=Enteractinococcus coprophilus TaxID=1027633 RepID=A0A543A0V0_9MICC|nr:D-arabinono-1,4-lactone oxidase [Enteractinococcus coprophilus]TQL66106.1 FAD-linked oxidoreductase [Enteractinococcus coprophilus]